MIIPYGVDAPVYHKPWATVGLMVANVLGYVLYSATPDAEIWQSLSLQVGKGLLLHQWVTSMFLHDYWRDMLMNVLFLWVFGLVVEGKVGWKMFLGIYFACGIAVMGGIQMALFDDVGDERSFYGAGGAVSGLMAVAGVWAPRNEVDFKNLFTWNSFSWPLLYLLIFNLVVGLILALLSDFAVVAVCAVLFGMGLGAGIAVLFLKQNLVDCEGWDLLTIRQHGRPLMNAEDRRKAAARAALSGKGPGKGPAANDSAPGESVAEIEAKMRDETEAKLREQLAAGDFAGFKATHAQALPVLTPWKLPPELVRGLAHAHFSTGDHHGAAEVLEQALAECPPEEAPGLKLALAQEYIVYLGKPNSGIDLLSEVNESGLSPARRKLAADLLAQAQKAIANGAMEMA